MSEQGPQQRKRSVGSAILTLCTHGVLPLAWLVFLVFIAPHIIAVLEETNTALPMAVQWLVHAGQITGRFAVLVLGILAAALLADVLIYLALAQSRRPYLAVLWSLCIVLLEIVVTCLLFAATYLGLLSTAATGM